MSISRAFVSIKDEDPLERKEAALALKYGGEKAVKVLGKALLEDSHGFVFC
jgi:hypothetical protein